LSIVQVSLERIEQLFVQEFLNREYKKDTEPRRGYFSAFSCS